MRDQCTYNVPKHHSSCCNPYRWSILFPFLGDALRFLRPSYSRKKTSTKVPKGERGRGENTKLKAAGTRSKAKSFTKATECGAKSDSEPALATATEATAADAAAARNGTACQSMVTSPTDRQPRQQEAIDAPPTPAPLSSGAVAAKPRACKFWRTAAGCRAGSACKFRHDETPAGGDRGNGGGGGNALKNRQGETSVAAFVGSARAGVCGAGERWRPGGGGTTGYGAGLARFGVNRSDNGVASGEGMEDDGGVDELISGMSKLMVPRHLRVGSSARRGDPIG